MGALGTLALGIGSLGTSYAQAKAVDSQGKYQQSQGETNARISEFQASQAIDQGVQDKKQVRRNTNRTIGEQRAALAAQGVDVGAGTAKRLQEQTRMAGEADEVTVTSNAWRQAWGFKVDALNSRSGAAMARLGSDNASRNTLLTGGLNAVSYGVEALSKKRS